MAKRVLSSPEMFRAARAIEENAEDLRELPTNMERAIALSKLVGFELTASNFVNAANAVDPDLFPKTRSATLRDQVRLLSHKVQNLEQRIQELEGSARRAVDAEQ